MKNRTLLLLSAAILLAIASCKKDTEVNTDTFKIEKEEVTALTQSVLIKGSYDYSGTIDAITFELGRQADLIDGDAYRTLIEGTDFSVEVKNLRTNTTYYYRYAVEYGGKSPYRTEIKTFKTMEYKLPEVASKEVISVAVNRAEVSGEVLSDGGGDAVTLRGICWSTGHNPSVGDEYANAGEGLGTFTCELTNLQPEKTYYARAFAGNSKGVSYGDELTFVTLAAGSLAEVRTLGITGNAMLQATVSGEVTNEGTSSVLERGVCYGKEHYPTTSGLHVSAGTGAGEYSCQLTNLEANTTYYVRAYAINSMGISYGDEMSFVAQTETTAPVVTTQMVSGITQTSATGHGVVVSDGGEAVTRRGLCWSTDHNPTAEGTYADCGSGVGEFSGLMPHLTDLTTYYVRAYAENAIGLSYGEEVSFTVGQHEHPVPPMVTTAEVTNISATTAVGGGNVTNDGGAEVTERGICWSTSHNPTIEGNQASNGMGTGSYTCMMTGLIPNTTYYVRAYAKNSVGTSYGEETEFSTSEGLPSVTTVGVTDITGTSAIGHGEVTEEGASTVTERGICWSTSHNPTIGGSHASNGTGTGGFTCDMTGLAPSTTYYVRAYAINTQGTAYGDEASFTALEGLPEVETGEVTDIGTTTATGHGEVTAEGASQVTERGICWSTDHNPTIGGSHASNGTGAGSYTVQMTDLTSHTTYYMKAYAINEQGTVYGAEVEFTTEAEPPTVTTLPVSNITQTTATGGGNVTDDGGAAVSERGICWSTSHDPTTSGNHATSGTGMGEFVVNITGLSPNTIYYVRAYAVNSKGLSYGEEVDFVTSEVPQYNVNVLANPPEGGTVTGGGNYQQGQQCTVTATAGNGYIFTNWTENGSVVSTSSSYTFIVTGDRNLVANFTAYSGGSIVESFETGDFSQFNWQLDPSYPWTITTIDPIEGIYCMKSGGAGVPNLVSNMTVTVNIPANGIMSFYCKISCENNWDYAYFYIDGVQKGSYTGVSSWQEKTFEITAGEHTFQWRYTKDSSTNSNDDCFYVDYISFYKVPEPAQPGWHTYCESDFNNAVGSNVSSTPSWAYEYPASFLNANYAGWNITKVSLFSDNMYNAVGGNYTCRIYVGGTQPAAGTMVSTITVDVPQGLNAWVDWDLVTPVNVTGNDPIWVVWTVNSALSSYPAGCCGDLNDLGTWWDGGNGWEHLDYGTWTMRHWFTNRSGYSRTVGRVGNVAPIPCSPRLHVKGEHSNASCANPRKR